MPVFVFVFVFVSLATVRIGVKHLVAESEFTVFFEVQPPYVQVVHHAGVTPSRGECKAERPCSATRRGTKKSCK